MTKFPTGLHVLVSATIAVSAFPRAAVAEDEPELADRFKNAALAVQDVGRSCATRSMDDSTRLRNLRRAIVELDEVYDAAQDPEPAFVAGRAADLLGRTDDAFNYLRNFLLRVESKLRESKSVDKSAVTLASLSICERDYWNSLDTLDASWRMSKELKLDVTRAVSRLKAIRDFVSLPGGKPATANGCDPLVTKSVGFVCIGQSTVPADVTVTRIDTKSKTQVGKTPVDLALTPGAYTLQASARGCRDSPLLDQTVEAQSRHSIKFDLVPRQGSLSFATEPEASRMLFIDPVRDALEFPVSNYELPEGRYEVLVRKPGYQDLPVTFYIRDQQNTAVLGANGQAMKLDIDPAQWGSLHVAGTPSNVKITLATGESKSLGEQFQPIPPGTSEVRFEALGYKTENQRLSFFRGKATSVRLSLTPEPKWYWPLLGYTAGGATALAGFALVGVAAQQQDSFYDDPTRAKRDAANSTNLWAGGFLVAGGVILLGTGAWHVIDANLPSKPVQVSYE